MDYCIVMPAYNEQEYIGLTLESVVRQTHLPRKLIVVNDSSTDATAAVVAQYQKRYDWIELVDKQSNPQHLPGSKVIEAFQMGLSQLKTDCELVVKLDADLILPLNYFESVAECFASDSKIGLVGGFAYIEKGGEWILENLTDRDHVRGAFKTYRSNCLEQIGGLPAAMGWDTVDELLCRYYGWKVVALSDLKVKHLKPTGAQYTQKARYQQGAAFYSLHYGLTITVIAALKLAAKKGKPLLFIDYIRGYFKAKADKLAYLVTDDQGRFIRKYRWQKIKSKLR